MTIKSLCLIHKSIRKQSKFTEHEYHKHRPRNVLFSEHVYFVQICPVFAGPVTNYAGTLGSGVVVTRSNRKVLSSLYS